MRTQVKGNRTLSLFEKGKESPGRDQGKSFWTDGKGIYSYGTCIHTKLPDGRSVTNKSGYSHTTTCYQNLFSNTDIVVHSIRKGASVDELVSETMKRIKEKWCLSCGRENTLVITSKNNHLRCSYCDALIKEEHYEMDTP